MYLIQNTPRKRERRRLRQEREDYRRLMQQRQSAHGEGERG